MAKRYTSNIASNIVLLEKYIVKTKFQDRALVPFEAIDSNWYNLICLNDSDVKIKNNAIFETIDGHKVKLKFILGCDNSKGDEFKLLQNVCSNVYDMKFEVIQSHWYARLGNLSGFWYLIEMNKAK